jgi:hypothetical protein
MKLCRKCNMEKPSSQFYVAKNGQPTSSCRQCKSRANRLEPKEKVYARILRWKARNPTRTKDARLRRKYGMSFEDYTKLLIKQEYLCAICKEPPGQRGLVVDHDHVTGVVRGLLCTSCNLMLGSSCDAPDVLIAGAKYLEEQNNGMAQSAG